MEPFLAEIRIMGFDWPPKGWARCDGQFLPINQNQALFALLGITYGGNGQTNFQLPDLRGRVPVHMGNGHGQGERAGEEAHTVTLNEMPAHTHFLSGSATNGNTESPSNAVLARSDSFVYSNPANLTALATGTVTSVGGSQAHQNMQPYLTLNFCIALQGIFPSHN